MALRLLRCNGLKRWSASSSSSSAFSSSAPSTDDAMVLVRDIGEVREVTLNHPKALNSLNSAMVALMKPAFTEEPKAIVLQGTGEKAFCAGGDVVAVAKACKGDLADPNNVSRTFFRDEYQLDYQIACLKTPVVAYLDGITMGGGVGISIHAPFRVATERTMFAMPEAAIGLFCDVGGSHFLPRLPGHFGRYLALTGARVKAADLTRCGLATHFVHSSQVEAHSGGDGLAGLLAASGADSVEPVLGKLQSTGDDAPGPVFSELESIERVFSGDAVEDILVAAEKEAAKGGSKVWEQCVKGIRSGSPLSLKVILEQCKRGAGMTLKDVFVMEYRIAQHMMARGDFYEGVRSLLLDKDKAFNWRHDSLESVSDAEVESFFAPLDDLNIPELSLPAHS